MTMSDAEIKKLVDAMAVTTLQWTDGGNLTSFKIRNLTDPRWRSDEPPDEPIVVQAGEK